VRYPIYHRRHFEKPHLRMVNGRWECTAYGYTGFGRSPLAANESWLDIFFYGG